MQMKKKWIFIITIITILVFIGVFVFARNNRLDELNGLWEYDNNTKYEFNGKGNGKIIVPMENIEFTYTIKDNVVLVDFKSEKSTDTEYDFKVSKDSLELKDRNQPNVNLELKKVDK